jgi:hypothetical protein
MLCIHTENQNQDYYYWRFGLIMSRAMPSRPLRDLDTYRVLDATQGLGFSAGLAKFSEKLAENPRPRSCMKGISP